MRTYDNLIKRMNMAKRIGSTLPKKLYFDDLAKAYKIEAYLRKSYESLMKNGIRVEFKEEIEL